MHITIEINTQDANPEDQRVLAAISGVSPVEAKAAPAAAPAAKAAAPAAKAAPKAKAEPEPEPEPDVEEEDTEEGDAPTLDDAVKAATALVSSGGAAKVKAALAAVGAKRVSEIKADKVAAFLAELD